MNSKWVAVAVLALNFFALPEARADSLVGSEWGLHGKSERFLQLRSEGRVSGSAGCNRFFGGYKISGDKLQFSAVGSTKKLCATDVMKEERMFFNLLAQTAQFQRNKTRLRLKTSSGKTLATLRQRDWD